MGGRGKRGKRDGNWDPMPREGAGAAEWRASLLDESPEMVEVTEAESRRVRLCTLPERRQRAVGGSLFCLDHEQTAVGEAGARELRQLQRELERMARITGTEAKAHAVRKFQRRVEQGDFAVLFSGAMEELMERAEADARLGQELDVLREAMLRAFREIEDPRKMAVLVSRLGRASVRIAKMDAEWRRGRGKH